MGSVKASPTGVLREVNREEERLSIGWVRFEARDQYYLRLDRQNHPPEIVLDTRWYVMVLF